MKLAIVTNNSLHHKYFITELAKNFDVELIFQPTGIKNKGVLKTLRAKKFFMYGLFWFMLKMISLLYNKLSSNSMMKKIAKNEPIYFSEAEELFAKIPKQKIHKPRTINSIEAIELVKKHEIDIICFLGGDLARKEFINSAKVCSLNFHSGISPYYNGNKTIFHAVKDYRPNFAGGTLMYITERIDGGGILAHYLPEITDKDDAATLFMKGVIGAVKLYKEFLEHIKENELPKGVVQQRSFKYVRNIDWNYMDDIKLKRFEKEGKMRIYQRKEEIIKYYDIADNDLTEVYKRSLGIILAKKKKA